MPKQKHLAHPGDDISNEVCKRLQGGSSQATVAQDRARSETRRVRRQFMSHPKPSARVPAIQPWQIPPEQGSHLIDWDKPVEPFDAEMC